MNDIFQILTASFYCVGFSRGMGAKFHGAPTFLCISIILSIEERMDILWF